MVGEDGFENIAESHEYLGPDIEFHNGSTKDHTRNPFGKFFSQVANEDGSQGYPNKVRMLDFFVVEDFNNICGDGIEGIMIVEGIFEVPFFWISVSSQIEQEYIKKGSKGPQLFEPNGGTSSCSVHEGYPILIGRMLISIVVNQIIAVI